MITDHNRSWYLFKKSFEIFPYAPGDPPVVAAKGLGPFYDRLHAKAGPLKRLLHVLTRPALKLWVWRRTHTVAKAHDIPPEVMRPAAAIARRRLIDPQEVLINHIDEARADAYIRRFEEATISRRLAPQYWRDDCVLQDKIRFAEACHAAGLIHPALRAYCRAGKVTVNSLPAGGRVFVKPAGGTGGVGAAIFDVANIETEAELARRLEAEAGVGVDWLAQDLLATHPSLREAALSALSCMRIVTILNEEGVPELVAASYKVATDKGAIVDNAASAGFRIGIDPETARLRKGAAKKNPKEYSENPANGARFEGLEVPFFAEGKALALTAHATDAFRIYPYAGWDVAITEDGPILIEGNPKATMTSAQRPGLMVMDPARFTDLIGMHLDRVS